MSSTNDPFPALNPGADGDPFTALCTRFTPLTLPNPITPVVPIWDLSAPGGAAAPPSATELLDAVAQTYAKAVRAGCDYLPLPYQDSYVEPLLRHLGRVVRVDDDPLAMRTLAEIVAGAIAQHQARGPVRQPVRQFLAIVSNLIRSFLDSDKRTAVQAPLLDVTALPPLVMFHPEADAGPALLATPTVKAMCGSEVAVAVLPAAYHRSPLAWVSIAHEACGHGVLRADEGLLAELIAGTRVLFGGGPIVPGDETLNDEQVLGLLWSYWLEETASDVYGILNIGPTFMLNLAALVSAVRRGINAALPVPLLNLHAAVDPAAHLDIHPPDLFRLHVAIGVIENLDAFPAWAARPYLNALRKISAFCARQGDPDGAAATRVRIRGRVEVNRDFWISIDRTIPFKDMAEAARRVGAYVATSRLSSLGNQSVQRLETWDLADEAAAQAICAALLEVPQVVRPGADGTEEKVAIPAALQAAGASPERVAQVIDLLRNDQFDQLQDAELTALGLSALLDKNAKESFLAALKANRIEDLAPGLIRPLQLDRIAEMGDDAQLLAGATLAALHDSSPDSFRWINRRLAWALNRSYDNDSLMGPVHLHAMIDRHSNPPADSVTAARIPARSKRSSGASRRSSRKARGDSVAEK
jgi:hypothetical protein